MKYFAYSVLDTHTAVAQVVWSNRDLRNVHVPMDTEFHQALEALGFTYRCPIAVVDGSIGRAALEAMEQAVEKLGGRWVRGTDLRDGRPVIGRTLEGWYATIYGPYPAHEAMGLAGPCPTEQELYAALGWHPGEPPLEAWARYARGENA